MRVVIRVLYAYCQSYSDLRRYSNKGDEGGRVVFRVLYAYCQSYSDLRGYSEKGGGEGGNPRTVRVTLTYTDTLTRGGGEGGNPRTVRVLSELL